MCQIQKKFYNIEEMSALLGKSTNSIYGHLARRQYDAVPVPMKLGRRLAWLIEGVEVWIAEKARQAEAMREKYYREVLNAQPKKRGRPTKAEEIARRKRTVNFK
jgi:predicted DNA-binding transcriptional regulator AlpA